MSSKGLGRGLDALLTTDSLAASESGSCEIFNLPIMSLIPNKSQPRKTMSDEGLEELASSIRSQGIIQPLLVRPIASQPGKYQILAGERRWRAAQKAELTSVPVFCREMSDSDVMIVALMENLQREDLNPAEEAMALQNIKDKLNLTQEALAERLGKSRSHIANALRLLQLPKKALTCLQKGEITSSHARCLLGFADNPQEMENFLACMLTQKLSVRDCESILANWKKDGTLPWHEDGANKTQAHVQRTRKKNPILCGIEKKLSKDMCIKTRLTGTTQKGRLVFTYGSEEELHRLLNTFGVDAANLSEEESSENP